MKNYLGTIDFEIINDNNLYQEYKISPTSNSILPIKLIQNI